MRTAGKRVAPALSGLALTDVERARFYSKIDRSGSCWLWTGAVNSWGYGKFWARAYYGAHRASYVLHVGPISDGMIVMHACDNRRCVNPDHLSLGTDADNRSDCVAKGRVAAPCGEDHGGARLTESQVREMRSLYAAGGWTWRSLARHFGLASKSTVGRIIKREEWRHVA